MQKTQLVFKPVIKIVTFVSLNLLKKLGKNILKANFFIFFKYSK